MENVYNKIYLMHQILFVKPNKENCKKKTHTNGTYVVKLFCY